MTTVQVAAVAACALSLFGGASAQAATQIGGAPPQAVQTQLCTIADVFGKLQGITTDVACRSGCATGTCPPGWMPTAADQCSPECGRVFEPFWDQCGEMLVQAHMGGMDEMGIFYDDCLEELYPPGSCGTFCNEHTYDCYLTEVHQACCDEEGTNCRVDSDVPNVCPVGCAIVFPEFLETCREHVVEHEATDPSIIVAEFEAFEQQCLTTDGLALVEYALQLVDRGCILDLNGVPGGGHRLRRLQQFLEQRLSSSAERCAWDEMDDLAQGVTSICCDDGACPEGNLVPTSCSPGCAVGLHQFTMSCGPTLLIIDQDYDQIMAFEESCLASADPLFFLNAIKNADCTHDLPSNQQPEPEPEPQPQLPCCYVCAHDYCDYFHDCFVCDNGDDAACDACNALDWGNNDLCDACIVDYVGLYGCSSRDSDDNYGISGCAFGSCGDGVYYDGVAECNLSQPGWSDGICDPSC